MTINKEKKRALVTGLTGFTGRYMAEELTSHGFEVSGFGQELDLLNQEALTQFVAKIRPHVVIHLAAIASVETTNVDLLYQVNILGTRHLLEAILKEAPDIEAVLIASSANVYGNSAKEACPLTELDVPCPANDYAVSKLAMEHMTRLWFDRLPIVITRPFNYTGVGQSVQVLLPKIVQAFREGKKELELGNLDVSRDFNDVRSVVNAYRRLIEVCPRGTTVNICSGTMYSLQEIVSMMGDIAGYSMKIKSDSRFVRLHEVKSLKGSPEYLQSLIGNWSSPPLKATLEWMYHYSQKL